jgi:hypothetical protein
VQGTYTLAKDTQVTVPFTLSVPPDASPGDHAGGIVALAVPLPGRSKSRVHFTVRQGVGVRVYLHVLGPAHPGLGVTDIRTDVSAPPLSFITGSSRAQVSFDVVNSGNTLFPSVVARAYATDLFGQRVKTFRPARLAAVLPGSHETVTEPEWSSLPAGGPVTVHVQLMATRVNQNYTSNFWIMPWLLIVVVVLALAVLVAFLLRRRKAPPRHARGRTTNLPPESPEAASAPGTEAEEHLDQG